MKCIYTEHCCCVSPTIFTSDIGTISDISTRDAVSVSRRSQNLTKGLVSVSVAQISVLVSISTQKVLGPSLIGTIKTLTDKTT